VTFGKQKAPNERRYHYIPGAYLKYFSDENKPGFVWKYWKNNPDNCIDKSINHSKSVPKTRVYETDSKE
jgi:hypothetical protein